MLALSCLFAAPPVFGDRLDLNQNDQQLHVTTGFAGSLFATEFLEWRGVPTWKATAIGSALVALAGIIKEYGVDDRSSAADLQANAVGIGGNILAQFTIHFNWTGANSEPRWVGPSSK